jgi:hypothetical protein
MTTDLFAAQPPLTELVHGALELERTSRGWLPHRLPAWVRARNTDPLLAMAEAQPAGVRLAFRTAATVVELDAIPTKRVYPGLPPPPEGFYDLVVDGQLAARLPLAGGDRMTVDLATGRTRVEPGPAATLSFPSLPAGEKSIEIWFPHNEATELVALRADAAILPAAPSARRRWLHHGSSISHGSNANAPTSTWAAIAASGAGLDLVNLGFSGSALLDPFVARTIRDQPADFISLKLGINLVNRDLMRLRAFAPAAHGFLDTIRDGHPTTPLLVVSPIYCAIHETTPGPSMPDMAALATGELRYLATGNTDESDRLTLEIIRRELAAIVAQRRTSDPALHYLDGRELYGPADAGALPLPDALHPDTATHALMGQRFAAAVSGWLSSPAP